MTVQAPSTPASAPDLADPIAGIALPAVRPAPAPPRWVAGAAVVALLATLVRLVGLGREPAGDELYHILAARQYLADGTFGIHGGVYDRVAGFTRLVAWSYRIFGDNVVAARLPALVFGVATAVLLFVWLRRRGLTIAAWTAALLLALDPLFITLSQLSRFYTIQHFCFVAGVIAAVAAVAPDATPARRLAAAAAAAGALLVALYCQMVTLVGIGGLALFLILVLWPAVLRRVRPGRRLWLTIGALAAAAVLGALVLRSPIGHKLLAMASYSDLWAAEDRGNYRYYHWWFMNSYPVLWGLVPLLAVAAVTVRPRLALLAVCVFGVPFVAHTLMAWKTPRYLAYAIPFFFVLAGLAAERLVPAGRRLLEAAAAGVDAVHLLIRGTGPARA